MDKPPNITGRFGIHQGERGRDKTLDENMDEDGNNADKRVRCEEELEKEQPKKVLVTAAMIESEIGKDKKDRDSHLSTRK